MRKQICVSHQLCGVESVINYIHHFKIYTRIKEDGAIPGNYNGDWWFAINMQSSIPNYGSCDDCNLLPSPLHLDVLLGRSNDGIVTYLCAWVFFPCWRLAVRTEGSAPARARLCAAVANISAAVPGQEVRRLTAVLGGYNGTPHWKESFKQKTNVPHATVTESAHLCLLQYWNFTSFKGCKTLRPSSQMSCFIVALSGLPPNHHPKVSSLLFTAIIFAIFVAICWGQCRLIPRGTISLWTRDVESSSTAPAKKNNRAALLFPYKSNPG